MKRYDDEFDWRDVGSPSWPLLAALVVFIALVLAIAAFVFFTTKAHAHDAPTGWTYPTSCCSGIDCREVADKAVEETRFGYRIAATGETIIYSDARIKNSPDGHMHWCSVMGADHSRTLCLFVPPKGF